MTDYEAVCFDLDDTLYDYLEYAQTGLQAAADHLEARTGEDYHERLTSLYFDEDVTEGTFDRLLAEAGLPSDLSEELVVAYHDANSPLRPYPETVPTLTRLAESYSLGLVTDGRGGEQKLRRLGIERYFDAVLVTHSMGASKQDPPVFHRVLSELQVQPSETVYVGDDPRADFGVPNQLGMTTIRILRGRYTEIEPDEGTHPDYEITALDEISDIL